MTVDRDWNADLRRLLALLADVCGADDERERARNAEVARTAWQRHREFLGAA